MSAKDSNTKARMRVFHFVFFRLKYDLPPPSDRSVNSALATRSASARFTTGSGVFASESHQFRMPSAVSFAFGCRRKYARISSAAA